MLLFGVCIAPASAQQKSAIQLELEKLYQQDSREMPDMRMQALPRYTPDGRVFENPPPPAQQTDTPVEPPKKRGLLDRIPWFRKPAVQPSQRPRIINPQQTKSNPYQNQNQYQTQPPSLPYAQPPQPPRYDRNYAVPRPLPQQQTRPSQYNPPAKYRPQPVNRGNYRSGQPTYSNGTSPHVPAVNPRQPGTFPQIHPYSPNPQEQLLPQNSVSQPRGPQYLPPSETLPPAQSNPHEPALAPAPFPVETPLQTQAPTQSGTEAPGATLPDLDSLPDDPIPLIPAEEHKPAPEKGPQEFFPDPFTEMSEEEADSTAPSKEIPMLNVDDDKAQPDAEVPLFGNENEPKGRPEPSAQESKATAPAPPEDENPFSGLKLGVPQKPKPFPEQAETVDEAPATSAAPVEAKLPNVDPGFKDEFNLPEGADDGAAQPQPELPKLDRIPDSGQPQLPAAQQGNISWEEEEAQRQAKLKLIAERVGETGLKGFCIVKLRDDRDLVDALPAFRSTYNLRTYHFSDLAAKIEFDKDPEKYVPAYDGNDPILISMQSEEREGSLDHALWFRGRLYLFVDALNKERFQRDPALYAAH